MTFALVIPGPLDRRSGGYSYDVDLVAHLRAQGHDVAIWSLPEHRFSVALEEFLKQEPEFVIFDALVQHGLRNHLARLARTKRGVWVGLLHLLAWHAAGSPGERNRLRRHERAFLEHMDAFIFNSEDSRREASLLLSGSKYRPSVVCCPPLGTVPEQPSRPTRRGRLLFLANVLPGKNLHGLLQALSLVRQRRPDLEWSLTIAGGEPDSRYALRCRDLARPLPVRWLGWVSGDDRDRLWQETDLLALPSFREGWGMAHAEALVRGIPSLAVPRGASLDVLGDSALWSEPDAASLADALERYLSDGAFRDDLCLRARHRAPVLLGMTGFRVLPAFWNDLEQLKKPLSDDFQFSSYLAAKRTVDSRALHPRVWESAFAGKPVKTVIELGGGTGTMIHRLLERAHIGSSTEYLLIDQEAEGLAEAARAVGPLFLPGRFAVRQTELLSYWEESPPAPDLVIAHAVLDLFDPRSAAPALARMKARRYWLTHLFDSLTAWEPAVDSVLDETIMTAYHRTMDARAPGGARGASRSGRDWLSALPDAGFRIIDAASSDWIVRPVDGAYPADEARFLRSMLHFFRVSLTGHPDVDQDGLNWWLAVRHGQVERAETTFVAHQFDVTAELM